MHTDLSIDDVFDNGANTELKVNLIFRKRI